ncbi:MAG: hypothetical protein M3Y24_03700 [Acidobacteriota bacterium]|nr:hypothetical protein [Acidobacteriota bacterium]
MPRVLLDTSFLRRPGPKRKANPRQRTPARNGASGLSGTTLSGLALLIGVALVCLVIAIHARYTFSLQSPLRLHFQFPIVVSLRTRTENAYQAQQDQRHSLTAYQQYACQKFGSDCRIALAIQRAENPKGKCEIYHYNADGTLDWGYFQINTVHLKRPGLNLRDLLDCKANIDFAYQLYLEKQGFTPWSTFNNGAYRRNLH